ncbi:MAG: EAL domain-containing protein [Burkholderiales bacterium]|nr:EAL domain-containing protein [Burkholderiales bacterium]
MSHYLPAVTSRRLVLAIAALLALLLSTAGASLLKEQRIAALITQQAQDNQERTELFADINDNAFESTRKLIILLTAPREVRMYAQEEINAAIRRLDSSMKLLPRYIDQGDHNPGFVLIADCLRRYQQSSTHTAARVKAGDMAGAHRMMLETTEFDLSSLIGAIQSLQHAEQQQQAQRVTAMTQQLDRYKQWLLVLSATGLLISMGLSWWIIAGIAAPLRAAASAVRSLAKGDYSNRWTVQSGGEVGEIATAFNHLADEVQRREQALRDLIDIDLLTGLAQRNRFLSDHAALADAARHDGPRVALFCFDIERLKSINAVLGFDAGDEVIVQAAHRASQLIGGPSKLARLGGGTLAGVMTLHADETPIERGHAFQRAMEHRIRWREHDLDIAVTVGLASGPEHGASLHDLLRRAEQALFDAKRQRRSLVTYSPSIEAARLSHLSMVSELHQAIEQGHLRPFLQAKLCLATNRIVGAEALVRWHHPERGMIPPAEFIPFAESTGRIVAITNYMLEQCIALMQKRLPGMTVAVNVSTYDLRDTTFPMRLKATLERYGVPAERLQIEITESGLLDSGDVPIACLNAIRELGVKIAIDDFGTGQSSLAYLQKLPAQELKIDRSFVDRSDADPQRRALLQSIVRLGHGLGMVVTAEGVETPGELAMLREAGCNLAQGYLIAKPMAVDDFLKQFDQFNARGADDSLANLARRSAGTSCTVLTTP